MKILGKKEVDALIEQESDYCVSLYQPVHRLGDPQDTIRYKNLLSETRRLLVEKGMRSVAAEKLLAPEYKLLEDSQYWKNPGAEGLAVFFNAGIRERYLLPKKFTESASVALRFRIKPLIPLLTGDGRFFILALSKSRTSLYLGSRFSISDVALPDGTPESIEKTLQYDDPQSQLQFHTGTTRTGQKQRQAMFHGQGVGIDEERENTIRFCQQIDKHLKPIFLDHQMPVVLVGVDALPSLYRETDSSGMLTRETINSNPDSMANKTLHEKAWQVVQPLFAEDEEKARSKFLEKHGTGNTSTNIPDIIKAAVTARIETLFVAENEEEWGKFNQENHEIALTAKDSPGAVDLLDFAAAKTLQNNGLVYVRKEEDLPVKAKAAAVLRY